MTSMKRRRGFTLIETLGAILVLAIGFVMLVHVVAGASALQQKAQRRQLASLWAQSKLDAVLQMDRLAVGNSDGRFSKIYWWHLTVEPWHGDGMLAGDESSVRLYEFHLKVFWGPVSHPESLSIRTLRAITPATVPPP